MCKGSAERSDNEIEGVRIVDSPVADEDIRPEVSKKLAKNMLTCLSLRVLQLQVSTLHPIHLSFPEV
jgi:hypothetical protein